MVQVEALFPAVTGLILLAAAGLGYRIYSVSGNTAVLWLALGLLFVAVQSFLEAFIEFRALGEEGFFGSETHFTLDAVRGFFIVLWAFAQVLILMELAGVAAGWVYYGLPLLVLVAGTVFTVAVNFVADIPDAANRLLVSSIGRVLGILVPVSLLLGAFFIAALARPTGSRGAMIIGAAFLLHAFTLPLYSVAKGLGPATLGLWYAVGGVIPALAAVYGFRELAREAAVEG